MAVSPYTPSRRMLESFSNHELNPSMIREVEEFLDSQDTSHPFQFPQWLDRGGRLLVLREAGKIRWSAMFNLYPPIGVKMPWIRAALAHHGPVCDDRELAGQIAAELPQAFGPDRICYVEIAPDWVKSDRVESCIVDDPEWKSNRTERISLRLDLGPTEEELFANFRKTSRYEIRRAERAGATVSEASTAEDIEEFLRAYQELATRKGFPADELDRMRRQISWLMNSPSRGVLLLARHEGAVCGGVVIARAARRCSYVWGATRRQPNLNAGQILQWEGLRWAKRHGCKEYDFTGYTPGATSGPAWFKAGFGGAEVHFVYACRKVVRRVQYRAMAFLLRAR